MKKTVKIEINFNGDGSVKRKAPGVFSGGVMQPQLKGDLKYSVHRQIPDEDGILNPVDDEGTVEGAFQINLSGTSEGFRKLGCYFIALSELDTSVDPAGYHDHFDDLLSEDKRTHIHLITRRVHNHSLLRTSLPRRRRG